MRAKKDQQKRSSQEFDLPRMPDAQAPQRPRVALICRAGPPGLDDVDCGDISMGSLDLHAHSGHHL
eukprot:5909299-Heterocapsa_arctica.AAC.1